MKQAFNQISKKTLFASLIFATIFMFSSCSKDDSGAVAVGANFSISGNANSNQVTPAPATNNSNGSGTISGVYNSSTKVMTYTSTWTNLTSAPLAAGFYSGAAGTVGSSVSGWALGSGLSATGTFSSSVTLNADQESQLMAGQFYYIMTTSANVSGEIRGQITATAQ